MYAAGLLSGERRVFYIGDLERSWNLVSMQTSWKPEGLMEFESDSVTQHEHQDKICLDKSGQQFPVNRCSQNNKQECNVPANDTADNTILSSVLLISYTNVIVTS